MPGWCAGQIASCVFLHAHRVCFDHSSAEITREIYIHSVPAEARNAVEKVEHLLIGLKWTQVVEIQNSESAVMQ